MKRFNEYTDEELAAMSDDEVAQLIAIECAHEGVPTVEHDLPEKPVLTANPSGHVIVNIDNLCVSRNVAECIRGIIEQFPSEVFERHAANKIATPESWAYPKFALEAAPTDVELALGRERRVAFDAAWAEYKRREEEHVNAINQRAEIAKRVHEAVNEADSAVWNTKSRRAEWDSLVNMCDGDTTIANRFYAKRFGEDAPEAWQ